MYNMLSADKKKDHLKDIKREIQTISEKLKNQITSGEADIDLMYHKLWKYNKVILYSIAWTFFVGRNAKWINNTFIYSRWKTEILTPTHQVLLFAGGDWCLGSNTLSIIQINIHFIYVFSTVLQAKGNKKKI